MAVKIEIAVIWVMMLCSDVISYQHFGGPWCLHLEGEWKLRWHNTVSQLQPRRPWLNSLSF